MFPLKRLLLLFSATLLALLGAIFWLSTPFNPSPAQASTSSTTRYVSTTGSDLTNDCTNALAPCASPQHAVDQAVAGDSIWVATGTYTGVQARGGMTQVVYISKNVNLLGGYNSTFISRNPSLYPTTLDAQGQGRVVSIVNTGLRPTLDGFTITGGNAHGVILNCPNAVGTSEGCGGGIFLYSSSADITHNVITGNVAATSTGFNSAAGGGLCLSGGDGSTISDNQFISNTASLGNYCIGGAMYLYYPYNVVVASNQLLSNTATTQTTIPGWGGGIAVDGSAEDTVIRGNWIQGNRTNASGSGYGAGIYTWYGSSDIIGNHLVGNIGAQAVYLGHYDPGHFEANRVIDNDTDIGVRVLNGNGGGLTLVNNVIANSGQQALSFSAYSGGPLTSTLIHNTLVGDGGGYGVYIESGYVTLHMTNTLVASYTLGITNTAPATSTLDASHTLFWGNQDNGITGASPVYGDPRFVNPSDNDFHLLPGSSAIDLGILTAVTTDIDGEPRPFSIAPDIGADESDSSNVKTYLPVILRMP